METPAPTKASSLRWAILRNSFPLRRPSPIPNNGSQVLLNRISRKTKVGFDLIPWQFEENAASSSKSKHSGASRDARVCYTLPTHNPTKLLLAQRVDERADLNDFEICNKYDIDNTGLVCHWPSEDVLSYFCLSHADMFRSKRVIELGSGYGLAGLVVAAATEAAEVVISDGNPQVVDL